MPRSLGRNYIALISKKDNPKLVSDFLLISLCNFVIKLFLKFWLIILSMFCLVSLVESNVVSFLVVALLTILSLSKKWPVPSIESLITPFGY